MILFEHPQRVRFKRHGDRGPFDRMGPFDDLIEKSLMADVDPVEVADGDDAVFKRRRDLVRILN